MFRLFGLVVVLFLFGCSEPVGNCDCDKTDSSDPTRFVNYSQVYVRCYDADADTLLWKYDCDSALSPELADTMNMPVAENIRMETETYDKYREQVISPVLRGRDYLVSSTGMWSLIKE